MVRPIIFWECKWSLLWLCRLLCNETLHPTPLINMVREEEWSWFQVTRFVTDVRNLSFGFRFFHKQGTNMVPILSLHFWNLYLMCIDCKFTPNHHSTLAIVLKICKPTWTMQTYGRGLFLTLSKAPNLATKILHLSKWIWISVQFQERSTCRFYMSWSVPINMLKQSNLWSKRMPQRINSVTILVTHFLWIWSVSR